MTKRRLKALLNLGAINAAELERVFDGREARERPPGLMKAIAEVNAAERAERRRKRR